MRVRLAAVVAAVLVLRIGPVLAQAPATSARPSAVTSSALRAAELAELSEPEQAVFAIMYARFDLFTRLSAQGRGDDALSELRAITAVTGHDQVKLLRDTVLQAYLSAAELLLTQGDAARAEPLVREGLARAPASPLYHGYLLMALSGVHELRGESQAAIARLHEAIAVLGPLAAQASP